MTDRAVQSSCSAMYCKTPTRHLSAARYRPSIFDCNNDVKQPEKELTCAEIRHPCAMVACNNMGIHALARVGVQGASGLDLLCTISNICKREAGHDCDHARKMLRNCHTRCTCCLLQSHHGPPRLPHQNQLQLSVQLSCLRRAAALILDSMVRLQ